MPRAAPEPVLSEVVRQRLEALLAEVPARRVLGPPPDAPVRAATDASGATVETPLPARPAEDRGELARGRLADRGRAAWEFGRSHLVAVGIVLLTGCLWAGYSVLQARSTSVGPPVSTAPTVIASPSPTPSEPARILVHVLGSVERPGVVELTEGARVRDAIAAAGGLAADADPGELNLAAVVSDGSQLIIGDRREPRGEVRGDPEGGGSGGGGGDRKLSLNSATQAQLEALPGVGPVTAGRIIAWRTEHGKFSRIEELQEIDGIGPKTYSQLAALVQL